MSFKPFNLKIFRIVPGAVLALCLLHCACAGANSYTMEFQAGWNMTAFPFVPSDPRAGVMFGADLPASFYAFGDKGYIAVTADTIIEPGSGYWIYFSTPKTFTFEGDPPPEGGFSEDIAPGWRMLGNPFSWNLSSAATEFNERAMADDGAKFYVYDPVSGSYSGTSEVPAFRAYWTHFSGNGSFTVSAALPPPAGFSAYCGDGKINLEWSPSTVPTAAGYRIFNCRTVVCIPNKFNKCDSLKSTVCDVLKETIADPAAAGANYEYPNGTQGCFAAEVISSGASRGVIKSGMKCATPSADPKACRPHEIMLVSPGKDMAIFYNRPTFIFVGAGDMDYYILTVTDLKTGETVFSVREEGEGAQGGERKTYQVETDRAGLKEGHTYTWRVMGYQNGGLELSSSEFSFSIYDDIPCCELESTPDCIAPSNGSYITISNPMFVWKEVEGAEEYLVVVYDEDGYLVSDINPVRKSTAVTYSGEPLRDGVLYRWNVNAHNGVGDWVKGNTYEFTKTMGYYDLPVPQWVIGEGKTPVVGGDQFVSLNWEMIDDNRVAGYAVYRTRDLAGFDLAEPVTIVYKSELGGPKPAERCPVQFTEKNPGWCDTTVTNGERYYYKLASAEQNGGTSQRSVLQSIRTPLQPPVLIYPGSAEGTRISNERPAFYWNPVDGNDVGYIITFIEDSTGVILWQTVTSENSLDYPGFTRLEYRKKYRWNVIAYNDNGVQSEKSNEYSFTFAPLGYWSPSDFCGGIYCAPQQEEPYEIDYDENSITLYWEKPQGDNVDHFNVYRCEDTPGVWPGVCESFLNTTENTPCSSFLSAVICFKDSTVPESGTYYYSVTAEQSDGYESYSFGTLEITLEMEGPAAPDLTSPPDGQIALLQDNCDGNGSLLCLGVDWENVSDAASYDVEIIKDGTEPYLCEPLFAYDPANPPDPPYKNVVDSSCEIAFGNLSVSSCEDSYSWRVRSRDSAGNAGPWSEPRIFFARISPILPIAPPMECNPMVPEMDAVVSCSDLSFYWSPIPVVDGSSCYKIEISETDDFSNIVWADDTENPVNSFPCPLEQCYQAGTEDGKYIPLTNGVIYSWRVGSDSAAEGEQCGDNWTYLDTQQFYKRPPGPINVAVVPEANGVALSWEPPTNCTGEENAISSPAVPPDSGMYLIYVLEGGSEPPDPATTPLAMTVDGNATSAFLDGLEADTSYLLCVSTADASLSINDPGHVSVPVCVDVKTLPE